MSNQTLMAGAAKIDITPKGNVWMDGMIRSHESEGIHDPLFVRALVISPAGQDKTKSVVLVSCDVCVIPGELSDKIRKTV